MASKKTKVAKQPSIAENMKAAVERTQKRLESTPKKSAQASASADGERIARRVAASEAKRAKREAGAKKSKSRRKR